MNKTLTSWLSVIVAFILCLPLYAWNGSGTYEDPYLISTASDLLDLQANVNLGTTYSGSYFLQTADIELPATNWEGIGTPTAPFKGAYDGDGCSISNLTITASVSGASTNAFGLFGYCQNATVENITTYGKIEITADYSSSACVGVGGVIGIGKFCYYAGLKNYCDLFVQLNDAAYASENYGIGYGVAGVLGIGRDNASKDYYSLENHGNITFLGMNGESCVAGVANFRTVYGGEASSKGFANCDNYGTIVADGVSNTEENDPFCAGILAVHYATYGGGARSMKTSSSSNFGDLITTGAVHTAGIHVQNGGAGSETSFSYDCTNYGNIRGVHNSNVSSAYVGIHRNKSAYTESGAIRCVNKGNISVSGSGLGSVYVSGVFSSSPSSSPSSSSSSSSYTRNDSDVNLGSVTVDCPNATVICGGLFSSGIGLAFQSCQNFGEINVVATNAIVGGIFASNGPLASGQRTSRARNSVSFGKMKVAAPTGNVGGIFSGRFNGSTLSYNRSVIFTNCYSLGQITSTVPNTGALVGIIGGYGSYTNSFLNCYALLGEGQSLVGMADATNGSVLFENNVGIKTGTTGGVAYSVTGSNNWSQSGTVLVSYADCYSSPSLCYGNFASGLFSGAGKTTNYYDLILPINVKLYPTPTASDVKNHTYTKALGFKRFIRFNK